MRTPDNIIDGAYLYIVIIFAGIPATYLYNLISAIIRSMGDSKTPVVFLVISSVMNIALDLVFIINLHLGVAGASLATVISQAVSGIGCLIYSWKKFEILHPDAEERRWNSSYMKTLCGMGVPMGLQYSITAIGSVILQSAVNTLGSNAVASMTAGSKIGMFFCCPFDAMGSTMATYGGQNVGAKKMDRISKGLKACSILGIGYAILAFGILALTGRNLALFFVERAEVEVIGNVYLFLLINTLRATYEAMREAVSKLEVVPQLLLKDAVTIPQITIPQVPIIKGDAKSVSIAAASIVAKVTRDRMMEEYDKVFPEYGFASNKGYGSADHIAALKKYGETPIHRKTFITHFI